MHGATLQATLFATLLALAVAVWMTLSPLTTETATLTLRNPSTGARAVCHAAFTAASQGGGHARSAVAICQRSCEDKGFRVESGPATEIDFLSLEHLRRAQRR